MVSTKGRLTGFPTSKIVEGTFGPVALIHCKLRPSEATDYFSPTRNNEVELQSSRERTKKNQILTLVFIWSQICQSNNPMPCGNALHHVVTAVLPAAEKHARGEKRMNVRFLIIIKHRITGHQNRSHHYFAFQAPRGTVPQLQYKMTHICKQEEN